MFLNPSHAHTFQIVLQSQTDLSAYEQWQVHNWQSQTFDLREVFAPVDWYLFGIYAEQWVSMLEIAERTAKVGDQAVAIGLIGSVLTVPMWRGHGYATAVLHEAMTFLCHQRGSAFALLLCMEQVIPFYTARGWHHIQAPLYDAQPTGKVLSDQQTMSYPCGHHHWPEGTIDLCGLPLENNA